MQESTQITVQPGPSFLTRTRCGSNSHSPDSSTIPPSQDMNAENRKREYGFKKVDHQAQHRQGEQVQDQWTQEKAYQNHLMT